MRFAGGIPFSITQLPNYPITQLPNYQISIRVGFSDCSLRSGLVLLWGSRLVDIGPAGHINGDSGLGDWPEGKRLLRHLIEGS